MNRDYNRDPNIMALERRGFIHHGYTLCAVVAGYSAADEFATGPRSLNWIVTFATASQKGKRAKRAQYILLNGRTCLIVGTRIRFKGLICSAISA